MWNGFGQGVFQPKKRTQKNWGEEIVKTVIQYRTVLLSDQGRIQLVGLEGLEPLRHPYPMYRSFRGKTCGMLEHISYHFETFNIFTYPMVCNQFVNEIVHQSNQYQFWNQCAKPAEQYCRVCVYGCNIMIRGQLVVHCIVSAEKGNGQTLLGFSLHRDRGNRIPARFFCVV